MYAHLRVIMAKLIIKILILTFALILIALLIKWSPFFLMFKEIHSANARRDKLLYQTDCNSLLIACKQVLTEVNEGKWNYGEYFVRDTPRSKGSRLLPKAIIDLRPTYIRIDSEKLMVELIGGMDHAGIILASDPNRFSMENLGMELKPGFWYYDDGFQGDPNREKKLRAKKRK